VRLDEARLAVAEAAIANLQRRVAALEAESSPISVDDCAFLAELLPVVGGAFGSEPVLIGELCRHDGVRRVLGARSPASLGQLFAVAAETVLNIDGYEIERFGNHGSRALWKIWRVQEHLHKAIPRRGAVRIASRA
jgi:hypothetical protein